MLNRTRSLYKTSFHGLSKETWSLSLILLVNRSGTMVLPFLTLYLTTKEMGRSLSEAGFVMALFGLGSVVGAFFGGKLSDKIGFFKVQVMTLLLGGLMFIVLGQLKSYSLICIATFVLSLVNEAFRPANSSAIAFYSTAENRTRSYSLNRLAINLGWAIGASIGGLLAAYNYELLFWVDGCTNLLAAFLLFKTFKKAASPSKFNETKEQLPILKSAYKDKKYLLFILCVTLFGLCFFQLFTTIPKYFRDGLHLSVSYIGLIMAINGLIIVLFEMVFIYLMEGKRDLLNYITIGSIICAISFLVLLIPGSGKLISLIMILIITVGEITAMPFMNTYWTTLSNERNRGQYAALFTMAWGIAQTLGPFLCALLIDSSGFNIAFIAIAIILLFASFGFWKLKSSFN